jgi:hypothetical protein
MQLRREANYDELRMRVVGCTDRIILTMAVERAGNGLERQAI